MSTIQKSNTRETGHGSINIPTNSRIPKPSTILLFALAMFLLWITTIGLAVAAMIPEETAGILFVLITIGIISGIVIIYLVMRAMLIFISDHKRSNLAKNVRDDEEFTRMASSVSEAAHHVSAHAVINHVLGDSVEHIYLGTTPETVGDSSVKTTMPLNMSDTRRLSSGISSAVAAMAYAVVTKDDTAGSVSASEVFQPDAEITFRDALMLMMHSEDQSFDQIISSDVHKSVRLVREHKTQIERLAQSMIEKSAETNDPFVLLNAEDVSEVLNS